VTEEFEPRVGETWFHPNYGTGKIVRVTPQGRITLICNLRGAEVEVIYRNGAALRADGCTIVLAFE
jgi:hypothetical protein